MPGVLQLVPPNPKAKTDDRANHFLRALPDASYARLRPQLDFVDLQTHTVLWEPDTPITDVYFPHSCVLSIIVPLSEGTEVEAGTVGREGFLGVPVVLGGSATSSRAIAQIAGTASSLPAAVVRQAMADDSAFRELCLQYAQALLEQTAQSVACNARHDLPQRCARWLLMTRDRVLDDEFHLTQEFLAIMLGVRRATVTVAASQLQREGLIRYRRGSVTVLDRAGLEEASCECYGVVRQMFEKLVGTPTG